MPQNSVAGGAGAKAVHATEREDGALKPQKRASSERR